MSFEPGLAVFWLMEGWREGWMGGWMDGWVDGWRGGWMEGWRDFVMGLIDYYGKLKGRGDEWEYDGTMVRVCDGVKGRESER